MTHRDRAARAGEDVDLAEVDLLALVVVACRAQDDEEVVLVLLELGALVRTGGILDRELVHREVRRDLAHLFVGGLVDSKPDEAIAARGVGRRLGDRHRSFVLAGAGPVVRAVDDHGDLPPARY